MALNELLILQLIHLILHMDFLSHKHKYKFPLVFSEAYKKENGESVSNKYVKMLLKDIVEKENKLKPFNDEKIVEILEKDEFFISRRTVAKYREELKIPNARLRKSIV